MSNKTRNQKPLDFLAGKGFYIILFVCIAAIAVSGYVLIFNNRNPEATADLDMASIDWLDATPTIRPVIPSPDSGGKTVAQQQNEDAVSVIKPTELPSPDREKPTPKPAEPSPSATSTPKPADKPKTVQFFWPVQGEVIVGHSLDELVFNSTMRDFRVHKGIDIEADVGTLVMAAADGIVKDIGNSDQWGTYVTITHDNGLVSLYANLQQSPSVIIEQEVTAGMVIGGIGQTAECEISEVPHLHFEISRDGQDLNPVDFLPE